MKRRQFIVNSLTLAGSVVFTSCAGGSDATTTSNTMTPNSNNNAMMPDESAEHARTWMAFTTSNAIWGSDLPAVQADLASIANAIAAYEPVSMLVMASGRSAAETLINAKPNKANITLVNAELNDLWMRDTGAVFVKSKTNGSISAIDFNFNGWGNKQVHDLDATVAAFVANYVGATRTQSKLVLEGGAIEVDGEGTAIIKESCVLNDNRNKGVSKADCEAELKNVLGLEKIIWLPGPAGGDITDAHTDFYARFTQPGTVVVSYDANDTYGEKAVTRKHIDTLTGMTDAKGRSLKVEIINVPTMPSSPKSNSKDFAAGYINFYLCNNAVILPQFGDAVADEAARSTLATLFPSRAMVQLTIDAIAAGGGGIHCTTQQQPKYPKAPYTVEVY